MMKIWVMSALWLFGLTVGLEAQAPSTEREYTFEAVSTENPDDTLSITADSPRPLWQALDVLERKYGIEVDYEDPRYSSDQLYGPPGIGRRLRGGRFTATIPLRKASSPAENGNRVMVESLVKQYNDSSPIKFEVHSYKSGNRIDVIPAQSYQQPLLSTPLVINSEGLSADDVINDTLRQVSKASGNCLERGGLIDNSLIAYKTSFLTAAATPARKVLAQVLGEMKIPKIWLLTYEPQTSCFVFGVFPVKEVVHDQVRPVHQSHHTK